MPGFHRHSISLSRFGGLLEKSDGSLFRWKFSDGAWPYNHVKAVDRFNAGDREKLLEARRRQENERNVSQASTDAIVADLTAGFWVSMLTSAYDKRFAWRSNLNRVFPNAPMHGVIKQ